MISRRAFNLATVSSAGMSLMPRIGMGEGCRAPDFNLNYMLASCMYGKLPLAKIIPEVKKTGATAIDLWPNPHGNQREQLSKLGIDKFRELIAAENIKLGCITQYPLGPFGLQKEMAVAQQLGCQLMVTGGRGPKGLKGKELKAAVQKFVEQMKPHLAKANECDVTIAIENHSNNLIMSPDSMKWLVELCKDDRLAIAFAPYHLEQDAEKLAALIRALGNRIGVFYAWQYGKGCMKKLPKDDELLQMPGRGVLDFGPILAALGEVKYSGWTEIFMHPVPRGIPILDSIGKVTAEINRSRSYLAKTLSKNLKSPTNSAQGKSKNS